VGSKTIAMFGSFGAVANRVVHGYGYSCGVRVTGVMGMGAVLDSTAP